MAEVNSIFKISGRVGNTIFVSRNGKCYARSVPSEVKNPNTPKQQMMRSRFRVAARFYQRFKDTSLGEVWRCAGKREGLSGYTLFMRENLGAFDSEGRIADFGRLRLAVGNRLPAFGYSVERTGQDEVTLRWAVDGESCCLVGNDRLMAVVLYGDRLFSPEMVEDVRALRRDGKATFRVARIGETVVYLYFFFVSPAGESMSNSQYLMV